MTNESFFRREDGWFPYDEIRDECERDRKEERERARSEMKDNMKPRRDQPDMFAVVQGGTR